MKKVVGSQVSKNIPKRAEPTTFSDGGIAPLAIAVGGFATVRRLLSPTKGVYAAVLFSFGAISFAFSARQQTFRARRIQGVSVGSLVQP